jgi:mono/diheme cytochrome c family protein
MMRVLMVLAAFAPSVVVAADGATLYKRCAACHLPTGAGVPGAYPPLGPDFATMAKKPDGRRYLVLAVIKGVSGPISVGGKPFRSVMPAQAGMSDDDVAEVLNHVAQKIAKAGAGFKPFTDAEVRAVRSGAGTLNASEVGQLHAKAGGK